MKTVQEKLQDNIELNREKLERLEPFAVDEKGQRNYFACYRIYHAGMLGYARVDMRTIERRPRSFVIDFSDTDGEHMGYCSNGSLVLSLEDLYQLLYTLNET